jgi:hypothetical protein
LSASTPSMCQTRMRRTVTSNIGIYSSKSV